MAVGHLGFGLFNRYRLTCRQISRPKWSFVLKFTKKIKQIMSVMWWNNRHVCDLSSSRRRLKLCSGEVGARACQLRIGTEKSAKMSTTSKGLDLSKISRCLVGRRTCWTRKRQSWPDKSRLTFGQMTKARIWSHFWCGKFYNDASSLLQVICNLIPS